MCVTCLVAKLVFLQENYMLSHWISFSKKCRKIWYQSSEDGEWSSNPHILVSMVITIAVAAITAAMGPRGTHFTFETSWGEF